MTKYTDHRSNRVLTLHACFNSLPGVPVERDLLSEYVTGFDAPEQIYVVRSIDDIVCALARVHDLNTDITCETESAYYE